MAQSSPTRVREREEVSRVNPRTLVIASVASASAALLVSQLWIAGTWIAAALTPVIVTLVSEGLNRPTQRIARAMTSDRTAIHAPPQDYEPRPERRGERFPRAPDPGPMRVYGRRSSVRRRKLAMGAAAITAVVAFVVAFGGITVAEVIGGRSLGSGDRQTTFLGGHSSKKKDSSSEEQQQKDTSQEQQRQQQTEPEATTPEETPAPTEESAPQQTTPTQTPVPQSTTPQTAPPATPTVPAQP